MDVLSHGALPLLVAVLLRRPRQEQAAAAVGGMAPDLDVLWAWAAGLDTHLFALTHRGWSHTVWGGPLLAVGLLFLLSRPQLARRWPRWGVFQWGRGTVVAAALAGLSHLVLDGLTITGVPAFWPLSTARFTFNVFFYSVLPMLVVSLVLAIQVLRGRATRRWITRAGVLLVVIVVVVGGLRLATRPGDMPEGAVHTPGPMDGQWIVTWRDDAGVHARLYSWRQLVAERTYEEPNRSVALDAVRACEGHPGFVAWEWNAWGVSRVNATPVEDGWRVGFEDAAQRVLAEESWFRRFASEQEEDPLRCHVSRDGRATLDRDTSFWG